MKYVEHQEYDMEVELTLSTFEEGGRKIGYPSTFTGPHIFVDNNEWNAYFNLKDRTMLHPGETTRAYVTFVYHPRTLSGTLYPGKTFLLHAGYHPIGKGKILTLLHFDKHLE